MLYNFVRLCSKLTILRFLSSSTSIDVPSEDVVFVSVLVSLISGYILECICREFSPPEGDGEVVPRPKPLPSKIKSD